MNGDRAACVYSGCRRPPRRPAGPRRGIIGARRREASAPRSALGWLVLGEGLSGLREGRLLRSDEGFLLGNSSISRDGLDFWGGLATAPHRVKIYKWLAWITRVRRCVFRGAKRKYILKPDVWYDVIFDCEGGTLSQNKTTETITSITWWMSILKIALEGFCETVFSPEQWSQLCCSVLTNEGLKEGERFAGEVSACFLYSYQCGTEQSSVLLPHVCSFVSWYAKSRWQLIVVIKVTKVLNGSRLSLTVF